MSGYRYKHGDRPLDGYTIQHGAGRGGFGEVYYALSDSGREVALKVIQGFEQIELRGVSQCMNLKSPHLVTIFDIRHNTEGTPFVIMEFVSGPSLRQIIDEAPAGLGTQKAAFFLREIAKGLTFLHEGGIVHRDLKPANIFFENGYVKIGDYGLSKAISPNHRSAQTITVGTMHYMAPEVGAGCYDRSIDIYALGAILYELLTGQVPYLGGSPAEILMKHMTAEPDVSGIAEPFAAVIRKSMARDPKQRYASVQEMVEAVFGAEHVRQSVSVFSPESLSMVAARVAVNVGAGAGGAGSAGAGAASGPPVPTDLPPAPDSDAWVKGHGGGFGRRIDAVGDRLAEAGQRVAEAGDRVAGRITAALGMHPRADAAAAAVDPIPPGYRRLLSAMTLGTVAVAAQGLTGQPRDGVTSGAFVFLASFGLTWGLGLARWKLLPHLQQEAPFVRRLIAALPALAMMALLSWPAVSSANLGAASWLAVAVPLLLLDWPAAAAMARPRRMMLGLPISAAVLAAIAASIFDGRADLAAAIAAAAALATQVAAPWAACPALVAGPAKPQSGAAPPPMPALPVPRSPTMPPMPPAAAVPAPFARVASGPSGASEAHLVPLPVRWLWGLLGAPMLTLGVVLCIYAASVNSVYRTVEKALSYGFGFGLIGLSVLCLRRSRARWFHGYWPYLFRPLTMALCAQSSLVALFCLSTMRLRDDEMMIALFFLLCPAAILLAVALVRTAGDEPLAAGATANAPNPAASLSSQASSVWHSSARVIRGGVSLVPAIIGGAVVMIALLCGLAAAVDLPGFIAAGLADPSLADQLTRDFGGYQRWPSLLRNWAYILCFAGTFIGGGILLIARRRCGGGHMVRLMSALALVLVAIVAFDAALGSRNPRWAGDTAGQAIDQVISAAHAPPALAALGFASAAMVVFFWPARRRDDRVEVRP